MMDWKMKVLFVLVLFGSVVPVSAQEAQEGSVIPAVLSSVLSVLAVTLTLLVKSWWRMEDKVTATNKKIDDAQKDLKDDAQVAHTAIGTNIRTVHTELGTNIRTVHTELAANIRTVHTELAANIRESEKRVTDNFNKRFDDLRDYIKLAMKPIDKDRH